MTVQEDKDLPLREDTRLLGRLLGDTVREQEGAAAFDLIEHIRRSSIAFRRDDDAAARAELQGTLDGLSTDNTMIVVRAFSYFSHLANLAEDLHRIRRTRAHQVSGSAPRPRADPPVLLPVGRPDPARRPALAPDPAPGPRPGPRQADPVPVSRGMRPPLPRQRLLRARHLRREGVQLPTPRF